MTTKIDARRRHVRRINGRPMDYTNPADFAAAALTQRQRRGSAYTHPYVLGCLVLQEDDVVALHALTTTPGVYTMPAGELSPRQRTWYRWRTKQAARQWLLRNPQRAPVRVVNLDTLSCVASTTTDPARAGSALPN
ncbi:MAG TPA: hypothetical protein VGH54_29625 [Mycobacterium sp.]|jgi:hypothetical protein|uniref:hypothetical protein n=1 Tax=Mycobacterium sp. TaxID=1785 RepID=UPI002F410E9E